MNKRTQWWYGVVTLILRKIIWRDDDQILGCTSNYEAYEKSHLFFEINNLDLHL
jgi:hypothetical protein